MKILLPFIPNYKPCFPAKSVPGGAEMFFHRVLRSLQDFDVTVLVSEDAEIADNAPGKYVRGSYLSKETFGRVQKVEYTKAILDVESEYDLIIFNDNFLSCSPTLLEPVLNSIAPKAVIFQHDPDGIYLNSFHLVKYHLHCLMAEQGTKVLYVSKMLGESVSSSAKGFAKSPYVIPGYDLPSAELHPNFQHFDINEVEPAIQKVTPTLGDYWVASGRAVPSKNLLFSIRSFLKSEQSKLKVFSCKTNDKNDEYEEIQRLCEENKNRVEFHGNRPQSELFDALLGAKGYIFSSKMESCGLAAFEALSAGCPVIYSCLDSQFFLETCAENQLVPRRVLTKYSAAINSVNITLVDKKRIKKAVENKWSSEAFNARLREATGCG